MLKILQRKMQFEKCLLKKIFEINQKIFGTENANDAATIRHLEVWMGGNKFSAAADGALQSMWNNSFS